MKGAIPVSFRQSQRVLRTLLLVVMAWMLGASGVSHTHSGTPVRTVGSTIQASLLNDHSVLIAPSEEEACAICLWKARTPYVPSPLQPTALPIITAADYQAATPRAPPGSSIERRRSRAPPPFLS